MMKPSKVSVNIRNAGKRVKESKKIVKWEFKYQDTEQQVHEVEFRHSIMSGKRRLFFDKNEVFSQTNKVELLKESVQFSKDGRFDHTWYDGNHLLRLHVIEKIDGFLYDIIVDNTRFSSGMTWSTTTTGPGNPNFGRSGRNSKREPKKNTGRYDNSGINRSGGFRDVPPEDSETSVETFSLDDFVGNDADGKKKKKKKKKGKKKKKKKKKKYTNSRNQEAVVSDESFTGEGEEEKETSSSSSSSSSSSEDEDEEDLFGAFGSSSFDIDTNKNDKRRRDKELSKKRKEKKQRKKDKKKKRERLDTEQMDKLARSKNIDTNKDLKARRRNAEQLQEEQDNDAWGTEFGDDEGFGGGEGSFGDSGRSSSRSCSQSGAVETSNYDNKDDDSFGVGTFGDMNEDDFFDMHRPKQKNNHSSSGGGDNTKKKRNKKKKKDKTNFNVKQQQQQNDDDFFSTSGGIDSNLFEADLFGSGPIDSSQQQQHQQQPSSQQGGTAQHAFDDFNDGSFDGGFDDFDSVPAVSNTSSASANDLLGSLEGLSIEKQQPRSWATTMSAPTVPMMQSGPTGVNTMVNGMGQMSGQMGGQMGMMTGGMQMSYMTGGMYQQHQQHQPHRSQKRGSLNLL
jgi:hypothetical protein